MRNRRRPIALVIIATIALLAPGCGEGERAERTEIEVAQAHPAELDPALASDPASGQAVWLTYTPLLTYRHAEGEDGTELIPGLAGDLPEVSEDGRTYTLTLREDLTYSNGAAVKPADFEHSVKRLLALDSPDARHFAGIVGARAYAAARDPSADIRGIEADEESREITIRLRDADPAFANTLAMSAAGLVPSTTPIRDLGDDPPPGVGPYELTDVEPGHRFALDRSEIFPDLDIPDIPTGNVERINGTVVPSPRHRADGVLNGDLDYVQGPPLPNPIAARASERYAEHQLAATAYVYLEKRRAPFDDPVVREALARAIGRRALASLSRGAAPGCSLLAPGVTGYDAELDGADCPYGDPDDAPDLATARALVRQAHAVGDDVLVSAPADAPGRATAAALAATLDRIGLDARTGSLPRPGQATLLTTQDRPPHPSAFFSAFGHNGIEDPLVESELRRLRREPDPGAAAEDWRELDAYVISPPQIYVVPYGHPRAATVVSERVDPSSVAFQPVYGGDLSSLSLEEDD